MACLFVFVIVLFASSVIDMVPAAALTGIMLAVVFHTFEWQSIPMVVSSFLPRRVRRKLPKCMRQTKIRRGDAIVIVMVTAIVVIVNLVYAVLVKLFGVHTTFEYTLIYKLKKKKKNLKNSLE